MAARRRIRKSDAIFEEININAAAETAEAAHMRGGNAPRKPSRSENKLRSEIVRFRKSSEQMQKSAPGFKLQKNEEKSLKTKRLSLSDREKRREKAARAREEILELKKKEIEKERARLGAEKEEIKETASEETAEITEIPEEAAQTVCAEVTSEKPDEKIPATEGLIEEAEKSDEEAIETEKKSKKRLRNLAAAAVLLVAAAYGGGVYYYSGHFLPYSKVEGVDIGNLSADEAEKKLTDTVRAEYIDLIGRNGRERLDLTGTDAMISFSSLSDAIKMQNSTEWFRYYIDRAADNDISVSVSCDEAALDSAMNGLSMLNPANVTVPHDAYIAVNEDTGLYEVVAEVDGNEIKRKALKKAITDALSKGERKLNLEKADVYFEPVIRADDEDLSKDLWRMSLLNAAGAELDLGADTIVRLDGQTVNELIGTDNHRDEERIREFVKSLADEYNSVSADGIRRFVTHKGTVKEIKTDYGWELDEEKTCNLLFELLEKVAADTLTENEQLPTLDPANYAVKAVWKKTAAVHDSGTDIGDTYVEIDMGEQNVYVFVDGECVIETPCVTGRMTKGRITPEGMYAIRYKQRNRTLTGYNPDGSVSYRSPVKYWMPFNRGIGLHDASWRWKFGGEIYKRSGSHGCVNLPGENARKIYDIVYTGMPVICYY